MLTPALGGLQLVATNPGMQPCNPGNLSAGALGMRAWGTTLHALPDGTYGVVESGFQYGGNPASPTSSAITPLEGQHLASFCGFIQSNGSGFGICKSCRSGGLAGAKQ